MEPDQTAFREQRADARDSQLHRLLNYQVHALSPGYPDAEVTGKSAQQLGSESQQAGARNFVKSYRPPKYVFPQGAEKGLGTSQLTANGPVASAGISAPDKSDAATGRFDTYVSVALAGQSGSMLDLRVSWAGTPPWDQP